MRNTLQHYRFGVRICQLLPPCHVDEQPCTEPEFTLPGGAAVSVVKTGVTSGVSVICCDLTVAGMNVLDPWIWAQRRQGPLRLAGVGAPEDGRLNPASKNLGHSDHCAG